MAENTCPLCGKKLRRGYCPDCGGGLSDTYEDRIDATALNNSDYNTSADYNHIPDYGNTEGRTYTTRTRGTSYTGSSGGNAPDNVAELLNSVGIETQNLRRADEAQPEYRQYADTTEKIPLKQLIFSKKHIWKFIITIFWGFIGLFIGIFTMKSTDSETSRVGKALFIFGMIMTFGMPIIMSSLGAIFSVIGSIIGSAL